MDLDAIAVFVKVVQAGSFSHAARLLGMPNTTVSAKVARLAIKEFCELHAWLQGRASIESVEVVEHVG